MSEKSMVPFDDYMKKEIECDGLKEKLDEANLEIKRLNQLIIDIEEDRNDNYKRIGEMEMYGLHESDFH